MSLFKRLDVFLIVCAIHPYFEPENEGLIACLSDATICLASWLSQFLTFRGLYVIVYANIEI